MPSCVACGAELEPPVRTPHTVYVKTLYRIGGQDYCRHHIIRAAAAAGAGRVDGSNRRSPRWHTSGQATRRSCLAGAADPSGRKWAQSYSGGRGTGRRMPCRAQSRT